MDGYLLVPKAWLEAIMETQRKILCLLEKDGISEKDSPLNGYISELEAKKLLGRKTTWFWQMRTSGRLAFAKVGSKIFYNKTDIAKLMNLLAASCEVSKRQPTGGMKRSELRGTNP
jgi:hypothetical protein